MLKTIALSAVVLLGAAEALQASEIPDYSNYSFEKYIAEFGKVYSSNSERVAREALFYKNLATIKAHNSRHPAITYYLKVNKFADLDTATEMARYKGLNKKMASQSKRFSASSPVNAADLPASVDWRQKGAVSAVKDQGGCGSCWAFSATESIESALYLSSGQMLTLSPQNVLECTPNPQHCGGTGGCEGAIAELAFQWAQGGIADINTVPYLGHDAPCDASVKKAAKTGGFIKLPENDGNALMEALATVGPISISVDASSWSFYGGGIYNGCNAASPDIDHAVQAVGYGTDSTGQGYWIVRNSWSASWGEQGFIRLYRGPNETCGTDSTPGDGSGCTGGPSVVKVCGTCGIWYDNSYPVNVTLA